MSATLHRRYADRCVAARIAKKLDISDRGWYHFTLFEGWVRDKLLLRGGTRTHTLRGAKTEKSTDASRELQDAIYNHRRTGPLIPTWLYKRNRKEMEKQMKAVAKKMVKDALKSIE